MNQRAPHITNRSRIRRLRNPNQQLRVVWEKPLTVIHLCLHPLWRHVVSTSTQKEGIPTHPACYHLLEDPVSISLAVDGGHTKKDRYIFSHNIIYNGTPLLSKFNLDRQPSSTHHLVRPILSVRALSEFPPASHMVSTLPALLFTITGTLSERLCSPAVELVARE